MDSSWWKLSKATRPKHLQTRFRPLYFRMWKVFCSSITFEKGRPINSESYIALLVHLNEEITKKWPQMKKKNVLFHKTMHHITSLLQQWQNYMNYTLNFFCTHPILQIWPPATTGCLQTSKECSREKRFGSNEEVISETEIYFEAKDKLFYKKTLKC